MCRSTRRRRRLTADQHRPRRKKRTVFRRRRCSRWRDWARRCCRAGRWSSRRVGRALHVAHLQDDPGTIVPGRRAGWKSRGTGQQRRNRPRSRSSRSRSPASRHRVRRDRGRPTCRRQSVQNSSRTASPHVFYRASRGPPARGWRAPDGGGKSRRERRGPPSGCQVSIVRRRMRSHLGVACGCSRHSRARASPPMISTCEIACRASSRTSTELAVRASRTFEVGRAAERAEPRRGLDDDITIEPARAPSGRSRARDEELTNRALSSRGRPGPCESRTASSPRHAVRLDGLARLGLDGWRRSRRMPRRVTVARHDRRRLRGALLPNRARPSLLTALARFGTVRYTLDGVTECAAPHRHVDRPDERPRWRIIMASAGGSRPSSTLTVYGGGTMHKQRGSASPSAISCRRTRRPRAGRDGARQRDGRLRDAARSARFGVTPALDATREGGRGAYRHARDV